VLQPGQGSLTPPYLDDLSGLAALPCAQTGTECADAGPFLDGTCCAEGDSLVHLATATAAEAVDLEFDGRRVYACGGFGVRVNDLADPSAPVYLGAGAQRCQRLAVGPELGDGSQVFWLAHHGDSWVETPSLQTWQVSPAQELQPVDSLTELGVRYEGLLQVGDHLFVAAHDAGLRVYGVGADGSPTLVHTVAGFDNAQKLAALDDLLFVTDDEELIVVDIAEPTEAEVIRSEPLNGSPRDVAAADGRVFVALGARGIDVFDLDSAGDLLFRGNLRGQGSSQAVDVRDGLLAVADWSHVSTYDARGLIRLGSERNTPYPNFEQDLGVALGDDGLLLVAEWEGVHVLQHRPGYAAADIWLDEELYAFPADEQGSREVAVHNRGALDLVVDWIGVSAPSFAVSETALVVQSGQSASFELSYAPPPPDSSVQSLSLQSNDPDGLQSPLQVPLHAVDSGGIDVGDSILIPEFAFLDPTGQDDVGNLQGNVLVLAYFALF
jgi:hypothetical protein